MENIQKVKEIYNKFGKVFGTPQILKNKEDILINTAVKVLTRLEILQNYSANQIYYITMERCSKFPYPADIVRSIEKFREDTSPPVGMPREADSRAMGELRPRPEISQNNTEINHRTPK